MQPKIQAPSTITEYVRECIECCKTLFQTQNIFSSKNTGNIPTSFRKYSNQYKKSAQAINQHVAVNQI